MSQGTFEEFVQQAIAAGQETFPREEEQGINLIALTREDVASNPDSTWEDSVTRVARLYFDERCPGGPEFTDSTSIAGFARFGELASLCYTHRNNWLRFTRDARKGNK